VRPRFRFTVLAAILVSASTVHAENWPQFRGPGGQGVSSETGVPVTWTATANVAWKTDLGGAGHSSPIVWNDRIFLTLFRETPGGSWAITRAINRRLRRGITVTGHLFVVCLDRTSGRVLWEREVAVPALEEVHADSNPAAPTPVTDGSAVYVYFGSFGLLAFDFAGHRIWERRFGPFPNEHGSASSPIVHGNALILNCDTEGDDFLLAVDKRTGKTLWQTKRDSARGWSTPAIWSAGGRDVIVINGDSRIAAYHPATGREEWTVDSVSGRIVPTPVSARGLLFVAASSPGESAFLAAIRPDGHGNITSTHVAWRHDRAAPFLPSPIVVDDYLFTVRSGGVMTCLEAASGTLVWQSRLPASGTYFASPVAVEGRIYIINEDGQATVVAAKPAFELLGSSDLGQRTMASPAVSGGQMFIRTGTHLWAIGRARS
jgi:outer membrane protein assembly factor BamB